MYMFHSMTWISIAYKVVIFIVNDERGVKYFVG
jgi:hypothetical protein